MDVDRIRAVGAGLDRQHAELDRLILTVSSLVSKAQGVWIGDGAAKFKGQWNGSHKPKMVSLSHKLAELAEKARKNAEAQEQTSAVLDGRASAGGLGAQIDSIVQRILQGTPGVDPNIFNGETWEIPFAPFTPFPGLGPGRNPFFGIGPGDPGYQRLPDNLGPPELPKWLDLALGTGGILGDLPKIEELALMAKLHSTDSAALSHLKGFGPLGWAGNVISAWTLAHGLSAGDNLESTHGVIGLGSNLLPGPYKVAAAGALMYASVTMPVNDAELDGTVNRVLEKQFGSGVNQSNLTPAQAEWFTKRYEGPGGFITSLSDGIDYKMSWLGDPAAAAGKQFGQDVRGFAHDLSQGAEQVGRDVGRAVDEVKHGAGEAARVVGQVVDGGAKAVGGAVNAGAKVVGDAAGSVGKGLGDAGKATGELFGSFFGGKR